MVPRHTDDVLCGDCGQLLLGERVLVGVPVIGEIAGDDDEIRSRRIDLLDRGAQQLLAVARAADMDVGELRDQHQPTLTGTRRRDPELLRSAGFGRRPKVASLRSSRGSCPLFLGLVHVASRYDYRMRASCVRQDPPLPPGGIVPPAKLVRRAPRHAMTAPWKGSVRPSFDT